METATVEMVEADDGQGEGAVVLLPHCELSPAHGIGGIATQGANSTAKEAHPMIIARSAPTASNLIDEFLGIIEFSNADQLSCLSHGCLPIGGKTA